MGNTHATSSSSKKPSSAAEKPKFGRQRRLSASNLAPPPTIQINGEESFDNSSAESSSQLKAKSASTDFSSLRCSSASERRRQFLTSSTNADPKNRSLDDSMTAKMMGSMIRTKSNSPLKKMRTYSFRSISSEDNLIDKECCSLLSDSWRLVEQRTSGSDGQNFGHFVLRRVFAKIPELRGKFGVSEADEDGSTSEAFRRHARLFTNILNITVKNVEELEAQVAPTVFKYGERHYRPDIVDQMTEENVRIFCAQIVCTVFDFLNENEATPRCAEAWIELMRYLGQKLLDGFEFARLSAERKISINRNDHHLFLML